MIQLRLEKVRHLKITLIALALKIKFDIAESYKEILFDIWTFKSVDFLCIAFFPSIFIDVNIFIGGLVNKNLVLMKLEYFTFAAILTIQIYITSNAQYSSF